MANPQPHFLSFFLAPIAKIGAVYSARRLRQKAWVAPVPVVCCGNLTTGGTGKTTVVLDLMVRLQAQGIIVHALIRGYKGCLKGPVQVIPQKHTARDVGDEALLLAAKGPTWVGGDRVASARLAVEAGAQCLIMDDGFQNPKLFKNLSLLIIDGAVGVGNGCVLPAGPLREPVWQGLKRADAVLLIGQDQTGFLPKYTPFLTQKQTLKAHLKTEMPLSSCGKDAAYIAFAGLGRPKKFFDGLRAAQVKVVKKVAFPDHYFYTLADLEKLYALAAMYKARLLTTPKDAVRLPVDFREHVTIAEVSLLWEDESALRMLLEKITTRFSA